MSEKSPNEVTDEIDRDSEARQLRYSRGRAIAEILATADPEDALELDQLIDQTLGSDRFSYEYDKLALEYYQSKQSAQPAMPNKSSKTGVRSMAREDLRLSDLLDRFLTAKTKAAKPLTLKTRDKYERLVKIMINMLDNPYAKDLTLEMLSEDYAHWITRLPKNAKKHSLIDNQTGAALRKLIVKAEKEKREPILTTTATDHVLRVKSFLGWAARRNYIDSSVLVALEEFKKPSQEDQTDTPGFSADDLKAIFNSNEFKDGKWLFSDPHRHWVPLIALYTGARAGEICQIHVEDISYDDESKIPYITLTNREALNKRLKTPSSKRQVPIHPDLVKLGFLNYVNDLRNRNEAVLFPALKSGKYGHWHRQVTDWFNQTYLKKNGVIAPEGARKSFHTFRHTFIDHAKQHGLEERVAEEIVGHAGNGNKIHRGYQKAFNLKRRYSVVKKYNYDIDLELIKKWK